MLRQLCIRNSNLKEKTGLPFHASILEQEENGDGEVIESKRPFKIIRITKLDGKVIYEF